MTLPPAGTHGGDASRVARALGLDPASMLDLSQSLNPVAPDPRSIIAAHLDALARYPDPSIAQRALADVMSVDADRLLLTNGGAEAIALVAGLLDGSVEEPEFSLHPRGTGPRWRSNPHSPTGLLARPDEQAAVWDEAFYPLATGDWTRGDDAIVVGSLTKVLACPGLRIGYVLADPSFIERCRRRQPEWSLNGLAADALPDLLSALDLADSVRRIRVLREELRLMLEGFGFVVRPSDANWLLVEYAGLREWLAPKGIVVRDCASFGLEGVTRIAVPNETGIARLGAALETLKKEMT
ncbi:MAG TPA: aminotransferase class I/II-fold pyridoxal phosphate-dependent enzyme [Acidimicrobiales bacterium]|nr:aminotransferase class I/II-fold pyridoxal phosphate-dependent enzyme [Acidimicrobiales bacterium]